MAIRAVFFDMGGTIETCWYNQDLRLAATPRMREILAHAGIDLGLDDAALCQMVSAGLERYRTWKNQTQVELPPERVWREFILREFPTASTRLASIAEALMFWVENHYYRRTMRPEMPAVAAAIHDMGLAMGVISNTCSRGQVPHNLEQYGLRQFCEPVVLSSAYGLRKPDPAIFHYAARLANVPAGACVYVGDSLAKDVIGARRAGFRVACQILNDSRDYPAGSIRMGARSVGSEGSGPSGASGVRPDAALRHMEALLPLLEDQLRGHNGRRTPRGRAGRQIQAVLFDAGDVLYHRPNRGKRFAAFLAELGHSTAEVSAAQREALKEQSLVGQIDQAAYREALVCLYGITDPEQIARGVRILEDEDHEILFSAGAKETLHALKKRGFLLGIVTDTRFSVSVKLSWLERGGFGDVWDTIISSHELGIRKPDPRIYQAALRQLGVSARQAVFVGHLAAELDGAQATGMTTIAYNYDRAAQADFYIDEFPELLKVPVIDELARGPAA